MVEKKVLVLEPYYGGSHKQFIDGIIDHVSAEYTLLSLPARKWKMRMQLSAPWFVKKIEALPLSRRMFDVVLCSTFLDVAVFRALAARIDGWNAGTKYLTYFHENQFRYPDTQAKQANHQFTAINFTTALASDRLAFNSSFNKITFINHCRKYLHKATDIPLTEEVVRIEKKSQVIYPPLDFTRLDDVHHEKRIERTPVFVWNHRWEHDKNPEAFFELFYTLKREGITFSLIILGERFRGVPGCFETARHRLKNNILHYGYLENKDEYYSMLIKGDYIISTAYHEFYGISVIEAVRAGCFPILPDRLSYPELFDRKFIYDSGNLKFFVKKLLKNNVRLSRREGMSLTEQYSWKTLQDSYESWLTQ